MGGTSNAAAPGKETVIVVHGTFAQPKPGIATWYRPGDAFVTQLDAALARRGSKARCWSHGSGSVFTWSGENNWLERTRAASDLIGYIEKHCGGHVCHLIGHSHGGNVIADALPRLQTDPPSGARLGRVVTLGTPFLDTTTSVAERRAGRQLWQLRFVMLGAWVFTLLMVMAMVGWAPERSQKALILWGGILLSTAICVWLYFRGARRLKNVAASEAKTFGLAVTSRLDEAWQLLHHVRSSTNPLELKRHPVPYLLSRISDQFWRNRQIARLHGAVGFSDVGWLSRTVIIVCYAFVGIVLIAATGMDGSKSNEGMELVYLGIGASLFIAGFLATGVLLGHGLISAMNSPVRNVSHVISSIAIIPGEIGAMIARHRGWSLLQSFVLGLDGFRGKPPVVTLAPAQMPEACFAVETLPPAAEQAAIKARMRWLEAEIGNVSALLSNTAIASSDLEALLTNIEQDTTLVHAAYYQDDACIERIADWIAGVPAAAETCAEAPIALHA